MRASKNAPTPKMAKDPVASKKRSVSPDCTSASEEAEESTGNTSPIKESEEGSAVQKTNAANAISCPVPPGSLSNQKVPTVVEGNTQEGISEDLSDTPLTSNSKKAENTTRGETRLPPATKSGNGDVYHSLDASLLAIAILLEPNDLNGLAKQAVLQTTADTKSLGA